MLSEKDLKKMSEIVYKDLENKAFVYAELDETPHVPRVSACGDGFNATVLIASLINQMIDRTGMSRLEYMHFLNQVLKDARGENE
jgi:hypothetical protein